MVEQEAALLFHPSSNSISVPGGQMAEQSAEHIFFCIWLGKEAQETGIISSASVEMLQKDFFRLLFSQKDSEEMAV